MVPWGPCSCFCVITITRSAPGSCCPFSVGSGMDTWGTIRASHPRPPISPLNEGQDAMTVSQYRLWGLFVVLHSHNLQTTLLISCKKAQIPHSQRIPSTNLSPHALCDCVTPTRTTETPKGNFALSTPADVAAPGSPWSVLHGVLTSPTRCAAQSRAEERFLLVLTRFISSPESDRVSRYPTTAQAKPVCRSPSVLLLFPERLSSLAEEPREEDPREVADLSGESSVLTSGQAPRATAMAVSELGRLRLGPAYLI